MILKGDCLSCKKVGSCLVTDAQKILDGFTCQLFEGVTEPEYLARIETMKKYGEGQAIRAILNRSVEKGDEEDA